MFPTLYSATTQPWGVGPIRPVTDALGRCESHCGNDKTLVNANDVGEPPRRPQDGSVLGHLKFPQNSLSQRQYRSDGQARLKYGEPACKTTA